MDAFFKLLAAGPMFFVSAWLLMIFAGITHADLGIAPFGYLTAMVVTIGLWLSSRAGNWRSIADHSQEEAVVICRRADRQVIGDQWPLFRIGRMR